MLDTSHKIIRVIKDVQNQLSTLQYALADLPSTPRQISLTKESEAAKPAYT
jgi:hypothetical protein